MAWEWAELGAVADRLAEGLLPLETCEYCASDGDPTKVAGLGSRGELCASVFAEALTVFDLAWDQRVATAWLRTLR
jgi:hypothetical protein